jgi:hypothetical protein
MKQSQAYISNSLAGLDFKSKYGLRDYGDLDAPLVMFGMYDDEDLRTYRKHRGELTLVWQGMDSKDLNGRAEEIKSKECFHYSISHWITESLDKNDIHSTYAPISATTGEINLQPLGNSIYFYTSRMSQESSDYYGEFMIDEIKSKTGLNVHVATCDTYSKDELRQIYADSFINLRLTTFDGCPNTNLEMALMGRRSIFNGDIPGSIKWRGVDDICNSIMHEFYKRKNIDYQLAELTKIYVDSTNNLFK